MTKYKLLKKIEGIDWEVGEVREIDTIGDFDSEADYMSRLDLHNLLLNGTIEKVEENQRWRARYGGKYYFVDSTKVVQSMTETPTFLNDEMYTVGNYFQTREQAQAVADQIKELLIKSH